MRSDTPSIAYTTGVPMLCSVFGDGFFHKFHSKWTKSIFQFWTDGTIRFFRKSYFGSSFELVEYEKLNISVCGLQKMEIADKDIEDELRGHIGIKVRCKDLHDVEASFRVIFPSPENVSPFLDAIEANSKQHNVDTLRNTLASFTIPDNESSKARRKRRYPFTMSTMRLSVQRVLDKTEKRSTIEVIRSRRGAFAWLPVLFNNDLIHGSWWFLVGSLLMTVCAAIIVGNRYTYVIGSDDSVLTKAEYVTTWLLIAFCGIFYTLGSLGFVRAMSDPPMAPMFTWYHMSTDELFASWMFFVGSFLLLPYMFVWLSALGDKMIIFIIFLLVLVLIGQYWWVWNCYPHDESKKVDQQRMLKFFCCNLCCGSCNRNSFTKKHFVTDWLCGCWLVFVVTFWSTLFLIAFTVHAYYYTSDSNINLFVNITT